MIQGLRTVIYPVGDLGKAKEWYSAVLGIEPYFDEPFYVGYEVGGFELGLIPDGAPGAQGSIAYWSVPDADAAIVRFKDMSAPVNDPVKDVGEGIKVGSVLDPFGNVFGIIENPNFDPTKVR